MTRRQHLDWCKERALAELENGPTHLAFASMASDMRKHPETAGHIAIELGMQMLVAGFLSTKAEMREFIEGFN